MTRAILLRSALVIGLSASVTLVLLAFAPSLAGPVDEVAGQLFWAVPFVLATSLATFNNTLRVFDRIEKVIESGFKGLSQEQKEKLGTMVESTEDLTSSLLLNALIAIAAGLLFFAIGGVQDITVPRWFPAWWASLRPDLVAVSIRFGLGVLSATILIVQFMAIPPLVAFYRFFTVDRHLPLEAGAGGASAEVPIGGGHHSDSSSDPP